MKKASISHTKNNLSALLDRVRHGETILITDRDDPVARLEPVGAPPGGPSAEVLLRLERSGLLRRGRGRAVTEVLRESPPKANSGGDILAALLADREEGR